MKQVSILNSLALLSAALMLSLASTSSGAQGITRTIIEKADVSVENREAIVARVELAPGVTAARHTHPGDEISYVLEGEGQLLVDGEAPRNLKAGDAFVVAAGKVHGAKNTGSGTLRLLGVYVVEKNQALATPAK